MVLDTSGLLAAIDAGQRRHAGAWQALEEAEGAFVISPFVLAELHYLLATRVGRTEQLALLEEIERSVYRLEPFSTSDVARARSLLESYADLDLGLADASSVVLANRYSTHNLLTLDERHFRT